MVEDDYDSDESGFEEVLSGISDVAASERKDESPFLRDDPGPRTRNLSSNEQAYAAWLKDKTPGNLSKVIDSLSPTINSEITRYSGSKPLLRSKAKVLAIKAVKTFNPMSGARLSSWVVTNLQPLARYSIKQRDIKVPEVAARQAAEVSRVSEYLKDELGRSPTDDEIADEIGISAKRVAKVRSMAVATVSSSAFDEAESEDSSSAPGVETPSQLPFAQEAVYQGLSDTDRLIFDSLTGSHGKPMVPSKRVAAMLGVSPSAVSQRANLIARQITEVLENV
jgi:DNA-directed RNA polymerase specialized sigma subunit